MPDSKSIRLQVLVKHKRGLHLRCASNLAKIASRYDVKITLAKGRKTVDIASPLDIVSLSASPGTTLTATVSGKEASLAAEALTQFFSNPDE